MDEQEQLLFNSEPEIDDQKVVCLGLTFNNDEERRAYFRNELRKKLPQLKEVEGFPIGEDEDIIALSDPPYYTACPNPWINDLIYEWTGNKIMRNESNNNQDNTPFAADISEGKNDPIYNAHSYHTKVPYKAIMRYILHFTNPGDIIFDGFCGSGMTGIAAQMCGDVSTLNELNIPITENIGQRKAILQDLSPSATFLSYSYNKSMKSDLAYKKYTDYLNALKNEFSWLFVTSIKKNNSDYIKVLNSNSRSDIIKYISENNDLFGIINYTVWSEVYTCPSCMQNSTYNDFISTDDNIIRKTPICRICFAENKKSNLIKVYESSYDAIAKKIIKQPKKEMIKINYKYKDKRYDKIPDQTDILLYDLSKNLIASKINLSTKKITTGSETNRLIKEGIEYTYQLYTNRNFLVLNSLVDFPAGTDNYLNSQFLLGSTIPKLTHMNRYMPQHGSRALVGPMANALYLPPLFVENNSLKQIEFQLKKLVKAHTDFDGNIISTQSSTTSNIKSNSIDYIFLDPPFGSNIYYSELSFAREAWLKLFTDNRNEAIENKSQNKSIREYTNLMSLAFKEAYRILKPGKWITVEFSNTQASIWNALQHVLQSSGFIIASVDALNKQRGGFHAMITTTAVKQDLVISAYKPSENIFSDTSIEKNSQLSVWKFIEQHLDKLPTISTNSSYFETIIERTPRILFDRMIAYHIQNGFQVPISSLDFQKELSLRYPERDGMVFSVSQVAEYDKKRILIKEFSQMTLFVSDENSAIEWIRQQLLKKTQTRQDLHPYFMKEIQHIAKHEQLPELDDLLSQNFLRFDDEESSVPSQILTYLRRNYPDLRGLDASHPNVIKKALHRWYVPDPNKQADLEKLREKALLREFNLYVEEMATSKKKLKVFRTEAIRAGFKKAWSEKEFQTIITVGDRLPETIIQEDDKLLMYYDNAQIKLDM